MKSITFTFLFLIYTLSVFAQTTIVEGVVTDESGTAIIGANVFIEDTYDGASTDIDGNFQFNTEEKGDFILSISYIGYEIFKQNIKLDGSALNLPIQLKEIANELDMVVITAGAFEASDKRKGVILKPLDIVTTAGASGDIYGALNTLPGTQAVGEDGQLFVRGGAGYETRTFIDGMFVQKPYNSTVPDLPSRGRFSAFLFKGTTFSTGGYSAEYGQALSSALILETEDLANETITGISLMSIGGDVSHTHRWKNTSASISANYMNLAPYNALVKQDIDWIKPFQGAGGQAILRHKTSETGMFKVYASGNRNWLEMNYPDSEQVKALQPLSLTNDNYYFNTSYKELLNDKWSLFAGAAYTYNNDFIQEQFRVNTEEQSAQVKLTLSNQVNDKVRIKFGGEGMHNTFDEKYTNLNKEDFMTELIEDYAAGFVETDVYFSKKIVARLGGRVEYSDALGAWNLAPRASLAYKTGEKSQVSFAFGQFYQNPENELLRYQTDLNYERADHYMLNYQIMKNGRTFRIEGYQKNYTNLVKYAAEQPWLSNNQGEGYARGIDVFYRDQRSINNGDFWVSYSFLDTEREYRDFPTAARPTFASAHNLSLVYKHWLPKLNTLVGGTYSFASGRPFHDPNTTSFNGERTKAYNDLSVNASYLMNLFGNFTIIHLSVSNIAGFDNTFGYRFSNVPNADGQFESRAVKPPAKRFIFLGVFMSIGNRYSAKEEARKNNK